MFPSSTVINNFVIDGEIPTGLSPSGSGKLLDRRNNIVSSYNTLDFKCYNNYLTLLLENRDKWKNYGYLDLGLIPVIMGPSWLHDRLVEALLPIAGKMKLELIELPGASFASNKNYSTVKDYWCKRVVASEFLGVDYTKVRTSDVLLKLIKGGVEFENRS